MIPVLMALIAATGFALNAIFARLAGRRIAVLTGSGMAVLASLPLALIPALILDLPALARIPVAGFLWIVLLAFIGYPLAQSSNYASTSRIGAARASPLFASSPLWSTVLAVIFLGERPNGLIIGGTLAIVAGIILIVAERRDRGTTTRINGARTLSYISVAVAKAMRSPNIGYAYGLVAGACYGGWNVITKTAFTSYDIPPLLFAATTFAFGTFMFAPVLVYSAPRAFKSSKQALALFALSGMVAGIAVIALSFGLQKGDVSVVGPIVAVQPLITLVLVRMFLERLEIINPTVVTGSLLIVGGTIMVVIGDTVF